MPEGEAARIPAAHLGPEVPITADTATRVLDKLQRKDGFHIFREPVTDDVVCGPTPSYSLHCSPVRPDGQ